MAQFIGSSGNDIITPALITAGVSINPPGADLTGNDRITGNAGNDIVEGDAGNDIANLGAGSDRFIWNPGDGDDRFAGGTGTDTLVFNGSAGAEFMTVDTLGNGGFRFFRDLGDITVDATRVERIEVNAGDGVDVIDGSGQTRSNVRMIVNAEAGNDVVLGGAGGDRITGGIGDDAAFGLDGNDRFVWKPGDGNDTFNGGRGVDTLQFDGSDGAEVMTVTTLGGGGFRFNRDLGAIVVNTNNVERVDVNALGGNDTIDGSAQTRSDVSLLIDGGAGDDTIRGGAGNDSFEGNTGDDTAFGGRGNDIFAWDPGDGDDVFNGQSGRDTLEFDGSNDAEVMTVTTLSNGGFQFFRNVGGITVDTTSVERVEVNARGGNDTIDGRDQTRSSVSLFIEGGSGNDRVFGGRGNDVMTGGSGEDRFGFTGRNGTDRIEDFRNGIDRIRIEGYGSPLNSFGDLADDIVQVGANVHINLGANVTGAGRIILENFRVAQVNAADFQFI
jgi:Ca2+-binding RTX toxin-like protein